MTIKKNKQIYCELFLKRNIVVVVSVGNLESNNVPAARSDRGGEGSGRKSVHTRTKKYEKAYFVHFS